MVLEGSGVGKSKLDFDSTSLLGVGISWESTMGERERRGERCQSEGNPEVWFGRV